MILTTPQAWGPLCLPEQSPCRARPAAEQYCNLVSSDLESDLRICMQHSTVRPSIESAFDSS